MDSLPFNVAALNAYTSPPTNYLGATLFLSYIASALYLSTTITLDLWKQYNATLAAPSKDATVSANRAARTRHVKIYAFLASISFATLSYHMLSFLLASFAAWDGTARFEWQRASAGALGRWMLETALFEDFAKELVVDGASAICTQASVLVIWFWGIWVAQKARQRQIPLRTLLPFIVLGQNLPSSLTIALFLIQLHLSSPDIQSTPPPPPQPTPPTRRAQASLLLPTILLNTALLALPALRSHAYFPALVLFARSVLVLPYTPLLRLRDADVVKCITVSGGFIVAQWAMLRGEVGPGDVLGVFGNANGVREAVKTVGWDAGISGLVYLALAWGGGV